MIYKSFEVIPETVYFVLDLDSCSDKPYTSWSLLNSGSPFVNNSNTIMTYSNNMVAMATQLYVNMQYYVQLNLDSQNLFTAHVKLFSLHTVKLNSFNMCNEVSFHGFGMY